MTFEETFKNWTLNQKVEWALGPNICNLSENMRSIIVDLKDENERLKSENTMLNEEREKLKETIRQCDSFTLDSYKGLCERLRKENRKTLHALWMARAEAARKEIRWWIDDKESYPTYRMCVLHDINSNSGKTMFPQEWIYLWMEIHRKCREKAKEFE